MKDVNIEKVAKMFIRPPRREYRTEELGVPACLMKGVRAFRTDFELFNKRGERIICSIWDQANIERGNPCLIYCHGNYGCRKDTVPIAELMMPHGFAVCGFDFSGCGHSDGDFITLGWKETDDLEVVIQYLKAKSRYSSFAIWGRSMGASTTLFLSSRSYDPLIKVIVLDVPFPTLESCFVHHAKKKLPLIPEFLLKAGLWFVDSEVIKLTKGMSIYTMRSVDVSSQIKYPAYYGVGDKDDLTPPNEIREIYERHAGHPKFFHLFKAAHAGERSADWWEGAVNFICSQALKPELGIIRSSSINRSPSLSKKVNSITAASPFDSAGKRPMLTSQNLINHYDSWTIFQPMDRSVTTRNNSRKNTQYREIIFATEKKAKEPVLLKARSMTGPPPASTDRQY